MRSFAFNGITIPVAFKAIHCSRRAQLWNRQASIVIDLTTLALRHGWHRLSRMTTEEVLKALGRYKEESPESDRQTATKLGVRPMTLTAWLGGRDRPQRCMLARLAGFLRRVGYL